MAVSATPPKPVIEGQILDVVIETITKHGDALTRVDRFVVFVKDAHGNDIFPQQNVRIRILRVFPRYALAEVFKNGRN